jgi:hypothetical protein
MVWLIFKIRVWLLVRRVEQYHQWFDAKLRANLDPVPCRDCDVPEGMWW